MSFIARRRSGGLVVLALVVAFSAGAQGLKFEETVDYALNQRVALEGKAGEVEIRGIEFVSGDPKGGLIKGTLSSADPALNAVIITRLECATAAQTKWKAKITIDFLDADGELIDRTTSEASLKAEAKILEIKHTTLKYAASKIAQARLVVEAGGKV
jgi:hypothetical protein